MSDKNSKGGKFKALREEPEKRQIDIIRDNFFSLPDLMLCVASTDGYLRELNQAWTLTLGWSTQELSSKPWLDFVHPADIDRTIEAGNQLIRGELVVGFRNRYRCKSGEYRWLDWTTRPVGKELYCVARDITSLVQAEELLKQSEDRLKASEARATQIANSLPLIVWTANPDGNIDWCNDRWYEYLGHSRAIQKNCDDKLPLNAEVQPMHPESLHPDDQTKFEIIWLEAVTTGKNFQMEQRFKRGFDGQYRWHLSRAVPIKDSDGKITKYIGGTTDIHDQKLLTEDLRLARIAADAANQSKSAFLANMSHEIRTPMTAVLGFAEVLRDPSLAESDRINALSRIENSGRALLQLIEDVLDISKIEAGHLDINVSRFSPASIAEEVISLLRITAEKKQVELRLVIDADVPKFVTADAARVRQILLNLVGNAVKFTELGEVSIRLKTEDKKFLVVDVCDTGIGISESDHKKLFRSFAQADESITRKYGGSGLGLTLSRRLAEGMGGTLWLAESTKGGGSRFIAKIAASPFFYNNDHLPDVPEPQIQRPPEPSKATTLSSLKILIAEDIRENRDLINIYLGKSGAQLDFAFDGIDAIAKAWEKSYDLILMDIQMPNMDGIQATRNLREYGYMGPIVALTAHAMQEEINRSLNAGCNAHLTKPLSKAALIAAVSQYASPPTNT